MDTSLHSMNSLFQQLGLPDKDQDIEVFVSTHRLAGGQLLADAGFWTTNQRSFLREALDEDADWAELVDQLDARLRH